MPPKHALDAPEVNDLVQWVKLGAPDPRETAPEAEAPKKVVSTIDFEKGRQHWSFQPVRSPAPPAVQDKAWLRNELDAFTLARMEQAGVKPAPDTGRYALLRRVTYDLTGLPPDTGRDRRLSQRYRAGRLRARGRSPARLAALWRSVGPPLARRGAVRRHLRQCVGLPGAAGLPVSQLRAAGVQRRRAVRPLRARANRGRSAAVQDRGGAEAPDHRDRLRGGGAAFRRR